MHAGQHEVAYKGLGDAFLECDLHDDAIWESEAIRGVQRQSEVIRGDQRRS